MHKNRELSSPSGAGGRGGVDDIVSLSRYAIQPITVFTFAMKETTYYVYGCVNCPLAWRSFTQSNFQDFTRPCTRVFTKSIDISTTIYIVGHPCQKIGQKSAGEETRFILTSSLEKVTQINSL